jgi:poly-gamma-glutamate capsule biosynthesis protein CapA/YwtB (metallophosphatase superfamily)
VAQALRRYGFSIVSLANNHAIDYGSGGLTQTTQILDSVGLLHAGTGEDLAQARAPVFLGIAPRRVAMISVATSASPESRATPSRGEIMGRPGVNALKYAPDVTVDASVFATLKQLPATTPASKTDGKQLIVSGKTIKKGDRTTVDIRADDKDEQEILAQIRQARSEADIVILTVHSHEPSNRSRAPAAFVQQFAHAAIDAGASLVIGHGPHQLRGVEVYKTGVIFYSLGNFAFDFSAVKPQSEDVFEAGIDLYRLALGAIGESESPPTRSMEDPIWSESVIVLASFRQGQLESVRLYPIDLGVDLPLSKRGTPRFASADRGAEILNRLTELSREYGTRIHIENGIGTIDR